MKQMGTDAADRDFGGEVPVESQVRHVCVGRCGVCNDVSCEAFAFFSHKEGGCPWSLRCTVCM